MPFTLEGADFWWTTLCMTNTTAAQTGHTDVYSCRPSRLIHVRAKTNQVGQNKKGSAPHPKKTKLCKTH